MKTLNILFALVLAAGLVACEKKPETAGEKLDSAIEATKEAAAETTEAAKEAVTEAADAAKEATAPAQ